MGRSERHLRLLELVVQHQQDKACSAHAGEPVQLAASGVEPLPEEDDGSGSSLQDWDMLFDGIRQGLRNAVRDNLAPNADSSMAQEKVAASLLRAQVLDGVSALDALHRMLQAQRVAPGA